MNFASKKMVENNPVPILTPRKAPLLEKIDALCENEKRSLTLLVINVSGKRFETYQSTLERFPNTLLGNAEKRQRYFNKEKGEYYFDRNRSAFNGILYYYQSGGSLETPRNVSETVFTKEVMFFELGDDALGLDEDDDNIEEEELPTNKVLRKIWLTFEHPSTSKFAKVLAIFSVTVILLSIVVFCLETIPDLDPHKVPEKHKKTIETTWFVLNTFCNVWFTIEFVLRLIASPNKCKFAKTTLNIIDLISILPYYVGLFLGEGKGIDVLRVIRVIRVVRIFKLTRHSRGLHILGNTIRASFQELVMLVLFLIIGVILFSSAVYYAESSDKKNAENFSSIPHSFWWAVVTMTTVGYGDISPVTLIGKLVGAMCAISGVLVIALPVPVIVSNFELFYKEVSCHVLSYKNIKLSSYTVEVPLLVRHSYSSIDSKSFVIITIYLPVHSVLTR